MLDGFKKFIMKGNVVDLAVGVVIGAAFGALVKQFTDSFINPLIQVLTGGGITAGIDFALTLAAELYSEATAQLVQLQIEYAPAPPFDSGSPQTAPLAVLEEARKRTMESRKTRGEIVERAAARLG